MFDLDVRDGLIDAMLAVSSGLEVERKLHTIVHTAMGLVNAPLRGAGRDRHRPAADAGAVRLRGHRPADSSTDRAAAHRRWHARRPAQYPESDSRPRPFPSSGVDRRAREPPTDADLPRGADPHSRPGVRQPVSDREGRRRPLHRGRRGAGARTGRAAGIAIDNARLYQSAHTQQLWIEATRDISTDPATSTASARLPTKRVIW